MLFLFAFKVHLAEFTSMLLGHYLSWVRIHKPHSRWDHVMLQYDTITGLIQLPLHLVQIPDIGIGKSLPHYNQASSMLYGWCDTGACSSFTNSSPNIDPPIWAKSFEFWFISPEEFIPLLYCPVFVHLGPLDPFDIVSLAQQWFLDSNSTI